MKKTLIKANFFLKTKSKKVLIKDLLPSLILKLLSMISWKKSMKWSDHDLSWGRPLRSIFLLFNNNKLPIKFDHLDSVDYIIIENDLNIKKRESQEF